MTGNAESQSGVAAAASTSNTSGKITTVIFDVDDTLYDVGTGFTAHRNTDGAVNFMVDRLAFPSREAAQALRDEYFERYHATAKGLQVAEAEGRLPAGAPKFDPKELSAFWADNLDFALLGTPDTYDELRSMLTSLKVVNPDINLVAFSNGPRKYVLRALQTMVLDKIFPDDMVFAVDDVLPACKPEPEAFEKIFKKLGGDTKPHECVMVEDSMKNIRVAKALGMRTVLIAGKGRLTGGGIGGGGSAAEETKPGDAPDSTDPAVDVAVEIAADMKDAIPGLWNRESVFDLE